jgi:hypothetical protein
MLAIFPADANECSRGVFSAEISPGVSPTTLMTTVLCTADE